MDLVLALAVVAQRSGLDAWEAHRLAMHVSAHIDDPLAKPAPLEASTARKLGVRLTRLAVDVVLRVRLMTTLDEEIAAGAVVFEPACPPTEPSPSPATPTPQAPGFNGGRRCGYCGVSGHRSDKCSRLGLGAETAPEFCGPPWPPPRWWLDRWRGEAREEGRTSKPRGQVTCTICGQLGHSYRTCHEN